MKVASTLGRLALALWRAAFSTNTRRVVTVCMLPGALLLLAGVYIREPAAPSTGIATNLIKNDPSREFRERQVGQVLYSPRSGDHCKRALFDNRTGAFERVEDVLCVEPEPAAPGSSGADRVNSMRKTFRSQ
jgi:hypothetical protein